MPFFRYVATDSSGARQEGTVEAVSRDEATKRLVSRGLNVLGVLDAPLAAPSSSLAAPIHRGPMPDARRLTPGARIKTRRGTDKERYFLFNQVASYLRAGVNPAEAFARLGQNWVRPGFRESFEEIARSTGEGRPVSSVLERYPYLYPPHVVGIFRAGEHGGFLPEACDVIAKQAGDSASFRRVFWWLSFFVVSGIACAPLAIVTIRSSLDTLKRQDLAGGSLPRLGTFFEEFGRQALGPPGIASLAALVLIGLCLLWWLAMPVRTMRHRLLLRVPTVGKRARVESLGLFSWALSMLTRSAFSAKSALLGAAEAMPNLVLRMKMEQTAATMTDRDKLSEALRGSRLLPPEFVPMVATGEMTGDVTGQVALVASAVHEELVSVDRFARWRVGCWVLVAYAIGFLFMAWLLYGVFYPNLMDTILGE